MANIKNGKQVLRGIIDDIMMRNDTEGWDADKWEESITDEMYIVRDEEDRMEDLCDLLAYIIDLHKDDYFRLSEIVCCGIAYMIGMSISAANDIGEECYLLK